MGTVDSESFSLFFPPLFRPKRNNEAISATTCLRSLFEMRRLRENTTEIERRHLQNLLENVYCIYAR